MHERKKLMLNAAWAALMVLPLPAICAEGPITLEGRWQFSVAGEGATAFIQDATSHLTLACYAGDSLLEMQIGESLYPYRGEPEFPVAIDVRGGGNYTPTFEIGMDGYWIRLPQSHPLIDDLRRRFEMVLSETSGAITATVSLSGSYVAIGKLLDWCQSHAGNRSNVANPNPVH